MSAGSCGGSPERVPAAERAAIKRSPPRPAAVKKAGEHSRTTALEAGRPLCQAVTAVAAKMTGTAGTSTPA